MRNGLSFVIPACNEAVLIGGCIESIQKSVLQSGHDELPYEIIVVLNRCTDETEKIAIQHGARCVQCEAKNLSMIRNTGVNNTLYDVVVTIDADSRMTLHMVKHILEKLVRPDIIGGGTWIAPERLSLGILCTAVFLLPFVIFERLSAGLFFFRKIDFDAIGGFDERMLSAEDIDFARRLKNLGRKTGRKFTTIWKSWIVTSCRKFDRFGDWYFVRRPWMFLKLLQGKDRRYSDLVWYDFHTKQSNSCEEKNSRK